MTVPANYAAVQQKLDIDDFIDYMLANYYVGQHRLGAPQLVRLVQSRRSQRQVAIPQLGCGARVQKRGGTM